MSREIVLDTETTGTDPAKGDRVIEIGCVEMLNHIPTGKSYHVYINPECPVSPGAFAVHGLSDEFLKDKPVFAEIADEFADFVGDARLVIHNAAFDIGFLNAELRRLQRPPVESVVAQVTDTLLMAREMFPGKSNSLDALCKRLEVDNSGRNLHGALLDAGLLAEVYIRMTRGQDSLVIDEVQAAANELAVEAVDFGALDLPVLEADAAETEAHSALLADLDKACGGKLVWRAAEPAMA